MQIELVIGQVLRWGLILSVVIVSIGGALYLHENGHQFIHYNVFENGSLAIFSFRGILREAMSLSAQGIIELGLLVLVLTQVLRVILTAWLFALERDALFVCISLGILGVLLYSLFWRY